ncbi:clumping factor B-like [Argiope bruennichi]|uniref:clumping factor B-like n=1 Tax=Argiope bruennichi TaxID=94029 RepID=UPI0024942E51|nr:clumping factor B-like [Argiope bruennichi]
MQNGIPEEKENYRYFRTTCSLLGFILSFLMAFFSFIVAEEAGRYYEYAILFGFVMLFITSLIFCYVMHESKRVYTVPTQPSDWLPMEPLQPEQPAEPQPQPEPQQEPELPSGPFWRDRSRHDFKYVRCVLGLPPGDSDETMESEIENECETIPLRMISKSGIDAESKESTSETSNLYQDADSRCEGAAAADVQSHSPKAGPSKIADKGSESVESKSEASTLEGISALSLSDSSEKATGEKQTEECSTALSQLSLGDSEKQAAEMEKPESSSTHAEDVSDQAESRHSGTSTTENGCQFI